MNECKTQGNTNWLCRSQRFKTCYNSFINEGKSLTEEHRNTEDQRRFVCLCSVWSWSRTLSMLLLQLELIIFPACETIRAEGALRHELVLAASAVFSFAPFWDNGGQTRCNFPPRLILGHLWQPKKAESKIRKHESKISSSAPNTSPQKSRWNNIKF